MAEAKRIEQYLNSSGTGNMPRRSNSSARDPLSTRRENNQEDTASIDSDFPPTHGDGSSPPSPPKAPLRNNPVQLTGKAQVETSSPTKSLVVSVMRFMESLMLTLSERDEIRLARPESPLSS